MKVLILSILFVVIATVTSPVHSAPLTNLFTTNSYQYHARNGLQPEYFHAISAYQDPYSPYIIYNVLRVHTDLNTIPGTVLDNEKPAIAHFPSYNYFGTPIYDFRYPLQPVYPVFKPGYPGAGYPNVGLPGAVFPDASYPLPGEAAPGQPGLIPAPTLPPAPTETPLGEDDGIEKLDEKVEAGLNSEKSDDKNENSADNDSVTIDAV
ncbi:uncharacterized protein [Prorops nasuta]|uniref:uncharacterized protein n=1 Tax=Prorops nasuta TaxID=863751 RepID=UPI0034CF5DE7